MLDAFPWQIPQNFMSRDMFHPSNLVHEHDIHCLSCGKTYVWITAYRGLATVPLSCLLQNPSGRLRFLLRSRGLQTLL